MTEDNVGNYKKYNYQLYAGAKPLPPKLSPFDRQFDISDLSDEEFKQYLNNPEHTQYLLSNTKILKEYFSVHINKDPSEARYDDLAIKFMLWIGFLAIQKQPFRDNVPEITSDINIEESIYATILKLKDLTKLTPLMIKTKKHPIEEDQEAAEAYIKSLHTNKSQEDQVRISRLYYRHLFNDPIGFIRRSLYDQVEKKSQVGIDGDERDIYGSDLDDIYEVNLDKVGNKNDYDSWGKTEQKLLNTLSSYLENMCDRLSNSKERKRSFIPEGNDGGNKKARNFSQNDIPTFYISGSNSIKMLPDSLLDRCSLLLTNKAMEIN